MTQYFHVFIFCRGKNIPRHVAECIHGGLKTHHINDRQKWPARTDFYIVPGQLSWEVESAAGRIGAMPVCLPAAHDWLASKVFELSTRRDVFIFCAQSKGDLP